MASLKRDWDCIIVGAGPTGAVAAYCLAKRGVEVLLLDKATFPRSKVCGGCLSSAAVKTLSRIGLGSVLEKTGAVPTTQFDLLAGGRSLSLEMAGGMSVSRTAFDNAVIQEAVAVGGSFQDATTAHLVDVAEDWRTIQAGSDTLRAKVILAADGLAGTLLDGDDASQPRIANNAYMGVSALVERPNIALTRGSIKMHCAPGGYVGMAQVEANQINIAAAISPRFVREQGGPGNAVQAIIHTAGSEMNLDVPNTQWQGVGRLTRKRKMLADHRLLILGDAAGYVEPFTGEGMAWAMSSAVAATDIVCNAIGDWPAETASNWQHAYRKIVADRQRWCRAITWLIRRPRLMRATIGLVHWQPRIARPILDHLSNPATQTGSLA